MSTDTLSCEHCAAAVDPSEEETLYPCRQCRLLVCLACLESALWSTNPAYCLGCECLRLADTAEAAVAALQDALDTDAWLAAGHAADEAITAITACRRELQIRADRPA